MGARGPARHAAARRPTRRGAVGRGAVTLAAVALGTGLLVGPSGAEPGDSIATDHADAAGIAAAVPGGGPGTGSAPARPGADPSDPSAADAALTGSVDEVDALPPDPDDPAAAVQQIIDLSHKAEQANQAVLAGQQKVDDALDAQHRAEDQRDAARRDVGAAQARVQEYRSTADWVAVANYEGTRARSMYSVVLSDSPQQVLDRMSALDQVTYDTERQLDLYRSAVADAQHAESAAARAADDAAAAAREAETAQAELVSRKKTLTDRIGQVRDLYAEMTGAARARLAGSLVPDGFDPSSVIGAGREYAALQVALTRIGDPYVWGATGPDAFDCSGLVQWAYKQVGLDLPRTSQQQARGGTPVDPADMQPGDVITFYGDASHVGIYAGDGMMVHASTFGVPVKIQAVDSFPIHDVRRY